MTCRAASDFFWRSCRSFSEMKKSCDDLWNGNRSSLWGPAGKYRWCISWREVKR